MKVLLCAEHELELVEQFGTKDEGVYGGFEFRSASIARIWERNTLPTPLFPYSVRDRDHSFTLATSLRWSTSKALYAST